MNNANSNNVIDVNSLYPFQYADSDSVTVKYNKISNPFSPIISHFKALKSRKIATFDCVPIKTANTNSIALIIRTPDTLTISICTEKNAAKEIANAAMTSKLNNYKMVQVSASPSEQQAIKTLLGKRGK